MPSSRRAYVLLLLALVSLWVGGSVALGAIVTPSASEHFTEFYVLGQGGKATSYPSQVSVGQDVAVILGIVNHEGSRESYRVQVWVADGQNAEYRTLLAQSEPLTLAQGQKSAQPIQWAMPLPGPKQQVDLLLLKGTDSEPYRQLNLWMDVK